MARIQSVMHSGALMMPNRPIEKGISSSFQSQRSHQYSRTSKQKFQSTTFWNSCSHQTWSIQTVREDSIYLLFMDQQSSTIQLIRVSAPTALRLQRTNSGWQLKERKWMIRRNLGKETLSVLLKKLLAWEEPKRPYKIPESLWMHHNVSFRSRISMKLCQTFVGSANNTAKVSSI